MSILGSYAEGAGGTMQMNTAIQEDLKLGQVRIKNEDMVVADFTHRSEDGAPAADGLLGFDVLQDFDIGLDLPHHLISLYLPQGCATNRTPWIGNYAVLPYVPRPDRLASADIQIQLDDRDLF